MTATKFARPELFDRESSLPQFDAIKTAGGWDFPENMPATGDVLVHVPPMPTGINDRYLQRCDGLWYVRWPGFDYTLARGTDGFPEQNSIPLQQSATKESLGPDAANLPADLIVEILKIAHVQQILALVSEHAPNLRYSFELRGPSKTYRFTAKRKEDGSWLVFA